MANFINTIDLLGDEVVANSIIDRSIIEFADDGLTEVGTRAFAYCTNLTKVTFGSKPTIYSDAFNDCTNLQTINVPWAEGEVANAPWGATNATINYNYTGG